jgi:FdhD protein
MIAADMTTPNGASLENKAVPAGVEPVRFISVGAGPDQAVDAEVVEESLSCISVNGLELATFMCTPVDLDKLAIGFLANEGLIDSMSDIETLHISDSGCVDIWLNSAFTPPERLIVTAGCGGGVTFDDFSEKHQPLNSDLSMSAERLAELMMETHLGATLYQRSRGIHTASLADTTGLLMQVEDIGRHNCLDKLRGTAMTQGISTQDKILFSSGRISSEMINKARQLGTPIVCSRTSPTSLSVALAKAWNITIVAYLRQRRMRIYTAPERVLDSLVE